MKDFERENKLVNLYDHLILWNKNKNNMYKFKLPIGDWSDDGHGKCEYFMIESNKSVEDVRELYFDTVSNVNYSLDGTSPYSPCSDYEDGKITKEDIDGLGLNQDNYLEITEEGYIGSKEFAELFIDFMCTHNEGLELKIVNDEVKMFPFYGFDEKKRHIGQMGYGLFY